MKYPENISKNEDGAAAKEQPLPFSQGGIVVGMNKLRGKERIYCIQDDVHTLCLGATRSGKSRTVVLQSICTLGLAGESLVISDPKAELYHYTHEFLQKLNYDVYALDFRTPEKSHHYNLLQPIIDAALRGDQEQAEMLAWDMTNVLVGKSQGEKIWTNGEMSVIAATILSVVWDNAKRPEYQNLTNVYWFLAEMNRQIGNKTPMQDYMKRLPPTHPARALLSISDIAPSRTKGSFYTSALTTLRLFTSKSIYAITHKSDFSLTELGEKKQALFIILPDEKTTFYPVASLMVSQLYELLTAEADKRGGRLKRRVNFILDEFGNFTSIADFTNKLTVGGGRGMRFNLFLQSFEQLKEKYDAHAASTIKSNCQTWIYLQADDLETLREVSEKLGTYTTSSYQLSASNNKYSTPSTSHSVNLMERKLLTVDEVRRVARPYQIVISRSHPAMMFSPDLSEWSFNTMLGLGDKEHNRQVREERERKRPVRTDTRKEVKLWNIWIYYQKDIARQMEEKRLQEATGGNSFFGPNSDME
ncbi:type IV secretory system conjugative DNA transfer family protein [Brevibacillus parabrevis]|uniref:VirD4-like conjugal transfer protein, CD1115 family n=1 Tax=Brevibacillus parabrevis TaxID=54914 RepID=UPI001C2384B3|nr:type IV secretory system conjugative DNA transfer family protein [Brevibacillus parabrevis]MBU8711128.1 type IV secretory system conjugative DNA transfer family protein [Brevibacillus parabrevis]